MQQPEIQPTNQLAQLSQNKKINNLNYCVSVALKKTFPILISCSHVTAASERAPSAPLVDVTGAAGLLSWF